MIGSYLIVIVVVLVGRVDRLIGVFFGIKMKRVNDFDLVIIG